MKETTHDITFRDEDTIVAMATLFRRGPSFVHEFIIEDLDRAIGEFLKRTPEADATKVPPFVLEIAAIQNNVPYKQAEPPHAAIGFGTQDGKPVAEGVVFIDFHLKPALWVGSIESEHDSIRRYNTTVIAHELQHWQQWMEGRLKEGDKRPESGSQYHFDPLEQEARHRSYDIATDVHGPLPVPAKLVGLIRDAIDFGVDKNTTWMTPRILMDAGWGNILLATILNDVYMDKENVDRWLRAV